MKEKNQGSSSQVKNLLRELKGMDDNQYLNIWNYRPSFRDINSVLLTIKILCIGFLSILFVGMSYLMGYSLINSIIFTVVMTVLFALIFFQSIFLYFNKIRLSGIKFIRPFEDCDFRIKDMDSDIFYMFNKKECFTTGVSVFEIVTLPENVEGNISGFLRSLYRNGVPFAYQIVHNSSIEIINSASKMSSSEDKNSIRNKMLKSKGSYNVSLYLAISYSHKSLFSDNLPDIDKTLNRFANIIESNFTANFSHHKIEKLKGLGLIGGFYTVLFKSKIGEKVNESELIDTIDKKKIVTGILKTVYLVLLSIFWTSFGLSYGLSLEYCIIGNVVLIFLILFVFWRELFGIIFSKRMFKSHTKLRLFNEFKFFLKPRVQDTIFTWNQRLGVVIGTKVFSVKKIVNEGFCNPDKFIRSISPYKLSFSYTTFNASLSEWDLMEDCLKYLRGKIGEYLLKNEYNKSKIVKWLSKRGGIWRFMFLISVSYFKFMSYFDQEGVDKLEEELQERFNIMYDSFKTWYPDYEIVVLQKRHLISSLSTIVFKHKFVRREGSYLPYSYAQGAVISTPNKIIKELMKGVHTKIAAEFNSPLNLENDIIIGETINTEFLREEVPFGFSYDQIKNLIITGGKHNQRNDIATKVVAELIKNKKPSIIFDFEGKYSRLIKMFEKTRFKNDFYYFKLGYSFELKVFKSDIDFDENSTKLKNYIYNVFSLALKWEDSRVAHLKNIVKKSPSMDLPSIMLENQVKNPWQKDFNEEAIMDFINEFDEEEKCTISAIGVSNSKIGSKDFLEDNKTVIIDLSVLKPPKNLWAMFILISKLINYTDEVKVFQPKTIIMPNIEYFFDKYFLDRFFKSTKVQLFLNPLLERGFGLVLLVNEISKLHPVCFNYFTNYLALKSGHSNDLMELKNRLNLQEIQGQGYYTSRRNNTYQIDYLRQQKEGEAIAKREDYDQPFPINVDIESIKKTPIVEYSSLGEYMKRFGYDFQKTEDELIKSAKKTILEKDFHEYMHILDEIINFLRSLKETDQIGNIHEHLVKKELFDSIKTPLSNGNMSRQRINKIRDDIFNLLVKHEYLVENHPRTASGSESIRTSLSVGPQYAKALDDFYKSQPEQKSFDIKDSLEMIDEEKGLEEFFIPKEQKEVGLGISTEIKHVSREFLEDLTNSFLIPGMLQIESMLRMNKYEGVIKSVKSIIYKFLYKMFKPDYNIKKPITITAQQIEDIVDFIINSEFIPYNRQEIYDILERIDIKEVKAVEARAIAEDLFSLIRNFTLNIQVDIES